MTEKQVTVFGALDGSHFNRRVSGHGAIEETLYAGEAKWPGFAELLADLYFGLYLYEPRYRERPELDAGHRKNADLMATATALPAWDEARAFSTLDPVGALYGTLGMARTLLEHLPPPPPEGGAGDGDPGEEPGEEWGGSLRRAVRQAVEQARDDGERLQGAMDTWGVDPGELERMDPAQALAICERLVKQPSLRRFAAQLGRMREAMREAGGRPASQEMKEIVDVTGGRSLSGALPTERAALIDPELEWTFWAKMAQEALLVWEYAGRERAAMGPFVMLVDVSGSTMGERADWAKALVVAMADRAAQEGRQVRIVYFDTAVRTVHDVAGSLSVTEKLALVEYFSGGGTRFEPPLRLAMETLQDGGWQHADVVLVTDGIAPIDAEFAAEYRQAMRRAHARTHAVLLDGPDDWVEKLRTVADAAWSARMLGGDPRPIFDNL